MIIIFFNEEKFLREAIESVFSQTYENWELILADDGSSDASPEIARGAVELRPDRTRYIQHPEGVNRGMSATRNLGIREASGEYLAFLDGDDVWLPQKLEQQVAVLESRPGVGMVYGKTEYWYDWPVGVQSPLDNRIQKHGIAGDTVIAPPSLLELFLSGTAAVPCSCSLLVRTAAVVGVDGF